MGNGYIRPLDSELLKAVSRWTNIYDEALHDPRPTDIAVKDKPDDFVLKDGSNYYMFCFDLGMGGDGNVVVWGRDNDHVNRFNFSKKIKKVTWLDNGKEAKFEQTEDSTAIYTIPFAYGTNLVVRVAKIETE
jgi:alpha-L-fucosidase